MNDGTKRRSATGSDFDDPSDLDGLSERLRHGVRAVLRNSEVIDE